MLASRLLITVTLLAIVSSQLILPNDLDAITKEVQAQYRPENRDFSQQFMESDESTAKPVRGIANATSGYLRAGKGDDKSKLFYAFHSCDKLKPGQTMKDVPVIIWLQGGPGSTSFLGDFLMFGPYKLEKHANGHYHEVRRPRSWSDEYNLLIIDNPRGTGYSVAHHNKYVISEDQVAEDMLNALLEFYKLEPFSSLRETPLYVFGESYAGHYVPAISKRLLEHNKNTAQFKFPLKGMGVGNGWTDPINQLTVFDEFGYSLGLLDYGEKAHVENEQKSAVKNIQAKRSNQALGNFGSILGTFRSGSGGASEYDFRYFGRYDLSMLGDFFNDKNNALRYNVDPSRVGTFGRHSSSVYRHLIDDFMDSMADRVAYVADQGLPIIIYNGQYDVICNTPSAINWIKNMKWSGQQGLYDAPLQSWVVNGTVAGQAKNYKNFTYLAVNKAGHFVPMDQIENSIDMLKRFTNANNKWGPVSPIQGEKSGAEVKTDQI